MIDDIQRKCIFEPSPFPSPFGATVPKRNTPVFSGGVADLESSEGKEELFSLTPL